MMWFNLYSQEDAHLWHSLEEVAVLTGKSPPQLIDHAIRMFLQSAPAFDHYVI